MIGDKQSGNDAWASLSIISSSVKNGAHPLVLASKFFNVPTIPGVPNSPWTVMPLVPFMWACVVFVFACDVNLPPQFRDAPLYKSELTAELTRDSLSASFVLMASELSVREPLSPPEPSSLSEPLPTEL